MVKGVVFAGGYGKRLKPLTDEIPKTLVEIKRGYTILDRQLLDFKYAGINDIYLLVGYKHKKIENRYGDNWKGLKINYLIEKKPMGTLWAIRNCSRYVNDDILVRNGDTISDINIKEMIRVSKSKNFDLIIALTKMKSPYAIVEIDGEKIKSFVEKPVLDLKINAGIYYIKKESFEFLNYEYSKKEIERTFFTKMVEMEKASYYMEDTNWFPVDNFKDLEELREEYKGRRDTPYGYIKNLKNYYEIYVKKDYEARISGNVKIIKGKGIIDNMEVQEGYEASIQNETLFYAKENSIIIKNKSSL
ncbi:MAG: nucleotidyltransferase family protein [Thermoplasmata archaeon]|nr:nucleotidyltransferase family protein [Thermoplasmata archaeon]